MILAAAAAFAVGACERDSARPAAAKRAPVVEERAERPRVHASNSGRCSECHGAIEVEWQASPHALAWKSPSFQALRKAAGGSGCDSCHAPLKGHLEENHPGVQEGVTCDGCHMIAEAHPRGEGPGFALKVDDTIRFGPLCDAKPHYFHKMGCAPVFEQAELCGGCHLLHRTTPAGEKLPVFTEYEEWKANSEHLGEEQCQACHMPGLHREAATGAGVRKDVAHHGVFDREGDLRKKAVNLELAVSTEGRAVRADVTLVNRGAGHHVPTGMPGKRLVLRVRRTTPGQPDVVEERSYARILVDAQGREVPFFEATRLESDSRLPLDVPRRESFVFEGEEGGTIRAELLFRAFPEHWPREYGFTANPDEPASDAKVSFGARSRSGKRSGLPRKVEVAL